MEIVLYSFRKKILLMLPLLMLCMSGIIYTGECMAEIGKIKNQEMIVILGASYAKGWNPGKPGNMVVINKGINGEQSFEMLARFERDVVLIKPRMVIIWGFINDIFRSKQEHIEKAKAKAKTSISKMVILAKEHGIIPVLATEVTIRGKDSWSETVAGWVGRVLSKKSYQDYVNNHVIATNKWLKEFAKKNNIIVLDFQTLLSEENGYRKKEYAAPDGSHISQKGYEEISKYTNEVLDDYFKNQ